MKRAFEKNWPLVTENGQAAIYNLNYYNIVCCWKSAPYPFMSYTDANLIELLASKKSNEDQIAKLVKEVDRMKSGIFERQKQENDELRKENGVLIELVQKVHALEETVDEQRRLIASKASFHGFVFLQM